MMTLQSQLVRILVFLFRLSLSSFFVFLLIHHTRYKNRAVFRSLETEICMQSLGSFEYAETVCPTQSARPTDATSVTSKFDTDAFSALEPLRHKTIAFVGDSRIRHLCMRFLSLLNGVPFLFSNSENHFHEDRKFYSKNFNITLRFHWITYPYEPRLRRLLSKWANSTDDAPNFAIFQFGAHSVGFPKHHGKEYEFFKVMADTYLLGTWAADVRQPGTCRPFNRHFIPQPLVESDHTSNINYLELIAACIPLLVWAPSLTGKLVTIASDNKSTVSFINRGTTKNAAALLWLKLVLYCSLKHDFRFNAVYHPGVQNVAADALIRITMSDSYVQNFPKFSVTQFRDPFYLINFVPGTQTLALENHLQHLRLNTMASSSFATRTSQWNAFQRFCNDHFLVGLPSTEHTVCLFIAHLSQRHLEYTSVLNYVQSVVGLHHHHSLPGPDIQHFCIKEALAGLKKSRHELPHQKSPITVEHLLHIFSSLSTLPQSRRGAFWAACLTAFNSLLRSSNLFPSNYNHTNALRIREVAVTGSDMDLTVRVLKTNRFRGEESKIPLRRHAPPTALCTVRAIERLLNQGFPAEQPLFSYREGGKMLYLSARQFNLDLRTCLASHPDPSSSFSTHSFRRGGTTFAIDSGIDVEAVKAQGNWRSDCYRRYVDNKPALKRSFAKTISQSFPSQP